MAPESALPDIWLNAGRMRTFKSYLNELGRSATTGWRWRQNGWISVIQIAGKLYISEEQIAAFERRAIAGEFARDILPPGQTREVTTVGGVA